MRSALLVLAGSLAAVIALVVAIGYALPVAHVAARDATLPQPPARVFAVLEDVAGYPAWRRGVASVEIVAGAPAVRWIEHGDDRLTFERVESASPHRLVTRIADPSLPFGGTWTYSLAADGRGTKLTITENGEVYNPLFRFMSRFVFGHAATIDAFLADLKAHCARAG